MVPGPPGAITTLLRDTGQDGCGHVGFSGCSFPYTATGHPDTCSTLCFSLVHWIRVWRCQDFLTKPPIKRYLGLFLIFTPSQSMPARTSWFIPMSVSSHPSFATEQMLSSKIARSKVEALEYLLQNTDIHTTAVVCPRTVCPAR